jgi:hypothetical protein
MTMRTFVDRRGDHWDVFEVYPGHRGRDTTHLPESFRGGWLCFQSASERRRLAPIPVGWESWEEGPLLVALEQTMARRPRTTLAFDAQHMPPHPPGQNAELHP